MVRVSALVSWALVFGAALGLGLWVIVSTLPRLGAPSLSARVAPFVADISPDAFRLTTRVPENPASIVGKTLALLVQGLAFVTEGPLGNRGETIRRLSQAGDPGSIEAFRARQLLWAIGGGATGVFVDIVVSSVAGRPLVGLIAVPLAGLALGAMAAELSLRHSVKRRAGRILSELPTVFEFTSLCLAAGETITDAVRRVARVGSGDFAAELAQVSRQIDAGVPLASALRALSARLELAPITRGIEQILGALDRGSPLAAVLQAQAQDAREDSKRELLEKAGQKEVVMLVPLVFLILPVTILFAVFPGLLVIQEGFLL